MKLKSLVLLALGTLMQKEYGGNCVSLFTFPICFTCTRERHQQFKDIRFESLRHHIPEGGRRIIWRSLHFPSAAPASVTYTVNGVAQGAPQA